MAVFLKQFHRQPRYFPDLVQCYELDMSRFAVIAKEHRKIISHIRRTVQVTQRRSLCIGKVSQFSAANKRFHSTNADMDSNEQRQNICTFTLIDGEISGITGQIKQVLRVANQYLYPVTEYYFDGQGKVFRPMLVMLMSRALNYHVRKDESITDNQRKIAMISEMIHTASLMHDDVIDAADNRRGKPSINQIWGPRKTILAGDFVIAMASKTLARIRDNDVVSVVSQIIEDLVRGEFMQLGSKEKEEERFFHYINKSFKKTGSLMANSCRAVAILGQCDNATIQIAYEYGRNIGICFQLIDDLLDFTSSTSVLGKPAAADLILGLATAPVLFAARQYPQLNALIMRRFSEQGDVEMARKLVAKSNGVSETRQLAEQHCQEAIQQIKLLKHCDSTKALEHVANMVLTRNK